MKNWLKIIFIILMIIFVIIIGFIFGSGKSKCSQTLMACFCAENFTGEIGCNSVSCDSYIFSLGILEIKYIRQGKEIIICEDGKEIKTENRFNKTNYKTLIFGKEI
jgi:hypothetical protein